jgi:hypothetical protein
MLCKNNFASSRITVSQINIGSTDSTGKLKKNINNVVSNIHSLTCLRELYKTWEANTGQVYVILYSYD